MPKSKKSKKAIAPVANQETLTREDQLAFMETYFPYHQKQLLNSCYPGYVATKWGKSKLYLKAASDLPRVLPTIQGINENFISIKSSVVRCFFRESEPLLLFQFSYCQETLCIWLPYSQSNRIRMKQTSDYLMKIVTDLALEGYQGIDLLAVEELVKDKIPHCEITKYSQKPQETIEYEYSSDQEMLEALDNDLRPVFEAMGAELPQLKSQDVLDTENELFRELTKDLSPKQYSEYLKAKDEADLVAAGNVWYQNLLGKSYDELMSMTESDRLKYLDSLQDSKEKTSQVETQEDITRTHISDDNNLSMRHSKKKQKQGN